MRWLLRALGFRLALAGVLTLATFVVLVTPAGVAAAAPADTACSQAAFQSALSSATTGTSTTISFAPGCVIKLASALTIGAGMSITVNGNGLVLDGQTKSFNVIDINDSADGVDEPSGLTLNALTIEHGINGIYDQNNATVNLIDSAVKDNQQDGVLLMGGVLAADYGGGEVTVTSGIVSGNGSIGVSGFKVVVSRSIVSGNGAGIDATVGADASLATVTDSTVSGNSGTGVAGYVATVGNSTVTGNGADGVTGRDVATYFSTISSNVGAGVDALDYDVGATILAANVGGNCQIDTGTVSYGYNVSTDATCPFALDNGSSWSNATADQLKLGPLADNDGPLIGPPGGQQVLQTAALGSGSMAIDAVPANGQGQCLDVDGNLFPTGTPVKADERGVGRPQGPKCDSGAYEAGATTMPSLSLSLNPASPDGSNGWYRTEVALTLNYSQLAPGDTLDCAGALFSRLPLTATTADQAGSVTTMLDNGTHTFIGCTISQDAATVPYDYTGPSFPLKLEVDTVMPTISITAPTNTASYAVDQQVQANYSCDDTGSGIASCDGPVPSGANIDTSTPGSHSFVVKSKDDAGNVTTKTVNYAVYGNSVVTLPGWTTVRRGHVALFRIEVLSSTGEDISNQALPVSANELDGPSGQVVPFDRSFRFRRFAGTAGYQLVIGTRRLAPGTWTLKIRIGGKTPTMTSVIFTVEGESQPGA